MADPRPMEMGSVQSLTNLITLDFILPFAYEAGLSSPASIHYI